MYQFNQQHQTWNETRRVLAHGGANADTTAIRYSADGGRIVSTLFNDTAESNWKVWTMPEGLLWQLTIHMCFSIHLDSPAH